ncbi:MAG TPA: hypothetical protein VFS08_01410 [Gemmatimonadaceae bacterium]|nr:hypothetical protein [Gemmatimonadaceae bacterium]
MTDERREDAAHPPRQTTGGTERRATETEREGMDLLGRSSVRDGAIPGVSDESARRDQRVEADPERIAGGPRRSPPLREHAGSEDGGLGASGGAAGGADPGEPARPTD